jgi:antitoxin StbD
MASRILADVTASITKLQRDLIGTLASGNGAAVAILNRNALAFYCVPADEYHTMVDRLEDIELNALADARRGGPFVEVGLAELSCSLEFLEYAMKVWRKLSHLAHAQLKQK